MNITSETQTAQRALIPRRVLFGDPDRIAPALSPDGTLLAYIAPHDGVRNVWVQPVDRSVAARPVTADRGRGITGFMLCAGGRLVYAQDTDGDENWRLSILNLQNAESRPVTPERGVRAEVLAYYPSWQPDRMLIVLNVRNPQLHDVYELDLPTGELTMIEVNPGHGGQPPFAAWLADSNLRIRGGAVPTPDGGAVIHIRDAAEGPYRPLVEIPGEDAAPETTFSFTRDNTALITATSLGAPATRLASIDVVSGKITTVSSDPHHDLAEAWCDPNTLEPVVAVYAPDRTRYDVLDPAFVADVERLAKIDDGDVSVVGSACSGRLLLAQTTAPHAPICYYLYNRKTGDCGFLFPHRDELACYRLASTEPFQFTARDGLEMRGYLTRPVGTSGEPLPAVVLVHGGPWARDRWCYNPEVQWLADRGYVVVQVNYRGSSGYGKAFLNAGNREWGRAMQHDLVDAVSHLSEQGFIDAARVGIYGGSYGGYAALCGAVFNGEVFRCAISASGPADLATLISSIPPYWQPLVAFHHARVGHPERDADRLREVSPLTHAASIRTPLLIAQGAHDPRVPKSQADQLITALDQHNVPYRYLLFEDEGHGLMRPDNRETFYAEAERFLATYLGGMCQDSD